MIISQSPAESHRGLLHGEFGLLDPEVPALARARKRAAQRRLEAFGTQQQRLAPAVVVHIAGRDVQPTIAQR